MTTIDDIGRSAALDALDDARRSIDIELGLADVLTASAIGDVVPLRSPRQARRWMIVASAAAVVATLVVVGIVVSRDRTTPVVDLPTVAPSTTESPSPTTTGTTTPTTTTVGATGSGLTVSYLDPPPVFEPLPFAAVDLSGCPSTGCFGWDVAVMDGAVVVTDDGVQQAFVVDPITGAVRTQPIDADLFSTVAGPGNVLYGLVQGQDNQDFAMEAVALDGPRAGEVVAAAPVGIVAYVELPALPFGHGPSGVVDRVRNPGAEMIGYVDENGVSITLDEAAPFYTREGDTVTEVGGATWPLEVVRHPDAADTVNGEPAVAPTIDGAAVVMTWIGPADGEGDFPPPSMPVVGWLTPDGNAVWRQLADGWHVGASDIWGTVLVRLTGMHLELAWLTSPDGATPNPPTTTTTATTGDGFDLAPLDLLGDCEPTQCQSVGATADGTIVSYDRIARSITLHTAQPTVIDVSGVDGLDPVLTYLTHVGPGDVAYLVTQQTDSGDPVGDLVAVALSGPKAGQQVARAVGAIDLSGDSDLVPTIDGLVSVGCCGFEAQRPADGASPVMRWVDSTGVTITDPGPVIQLEFGDGALVVTRSEGATERSWTVPNVPIGFRGMPPAVATTDGGAMVFVQDSFDSESPSRLVILRVDGSMEERSIAPHYPAVMVPDGSLIVYFDEWVRLTLR